MQIHPQSIKQLPDVPADVIHEHSFDDAAARAFGSLRAADMALRHVILKLHRGQLVRSQATYPSDGWILLCLRFSSGTHDYEIVATYDVARRAVHLLDLQPAQARFHADPLCTRPTTSIGILLRLSVIHADLASLADGTPTAASADVRAAVCEARDALARLRANLPDRAHLGGSPSQ